MGKGGRVFNQVQAVYFSCGPGERGNICLEREISPGFGLNFLARYWNQLYKIIQDFLRI